MGLIYTDVGSSNCRRLPPMTQLDLLVGNIGRAQSDIAEYLHQIRQILAEHPELERHLPESFVKPVVVIDHGSSRWQRRLAAERGDEEERHRRGIPRYRPGTRRPRTEDDPDAA